MRIRYESRTSIGKATRLLSLSTSRTTKSDADAVIRKAVAVAIVVLALLSANAAGVLVPAIQVVSLIIGHLAAVAR